MKAILATLLIAPCAATTFQPCPRPIDAPPIRLTTKFSRDAKRHRLQRVVRHHRRLTKGR